MAGALQATITDVNSIVTLGSGFESLKSGLNIAGKIADGAQPFVPLISTVFAIVNEVVTIYENAQHNKSICASLLVRVNIAKANVEILQLQPRMCDNKALYAFVEILKKIRNFMEEVSSLSGLKKYWVANSVQGKFTSLIEEFEKCMRDLHFTVTVSNEQQREMDQQNLNSDIKEMQEFLQTIAGGVVDSKSQINAVFEEVKIINEKVGNFQFKAVKINPKELEDPSDEESTGKSVVKKLYRGNYVSCKPTPSIIDDKSPGNQRIQAQLVILGKLKECPNILRFYGLSNMDDEQVMVFEWADNGNLMELYGEKDFDWDGKLHIALDICRGLVFLHSCDILHHDIRCKNIMLNSRLEPKIANFKYSRETDQNSTIIDNIADVIAWMAPEKMDGHGYTFKCEIFSFGMLLWELAFEKVPYGKMEVDQVMKHVKGGLREKITFGQATPEFQRIQKGFKEVIMAAWEGAPKNRIPLVKIFSKFQELSKMCGQPYYHTALYPDGSLDFDGTKANTQRSDSVSSEFDSEFFIPDIRPLKDGIAAHKSEDYETAWEIFDEHADLGNATAKYWKAVYLADGRFVEKDIAQAAGLFKEAADEDNGDACFRYAMMKFVKGSGVKLNREQFVEYMTKAANAGNAMAQYNLGDMYLHGKLSFKVDEDLGVKFLKLAALNGHSKALEELEKKNINVNE